MGTGQSSATGGSEHHREIDWEAAERSPEFKQLERTKRSFVIPATIFFLAWYITFILLAGYAPGFMGESVIEGLTVGYLLALSQFVMVWVLTAMYLRRAKNVFDPLAEKAVRKAIESARPEPVRPGEARPEEDRR